MYEYINYLHSCLVANLCPTPCNPIGCNTPGRPVPLHLTEFTQTHIHWVSDAIQPSHPLSSPSPPTFNLFQHQGLFQYISSSHQVAKVLEFQLRHESFQWIFRVDFLLGLTVWSPFFSSTTVQNHQFFGTQPSLWPNSHMCTWLLEKT